MGRSIVYPPVVLEMPEARESRASHHLNWIVTDGVRVDGGVCV